MHVHVLCISCIHQVDFFGDSAPVKSGEDGILIVRYPDGRASGDAFAVFEEEAHLEEALKLNRSNLGTRYVELYKSSVKEFQLVGVYVLCMHVCHLCVCMCVCVRRREKLEEEKVREIRVKILHYRP